MSKKVLKVLIVLTSQSVLGNTGKETGFYLPEVTHPYEAFAQAGFFVEFVSPPVTEYWERNDA